METIGKDGAHWWSRFFLAQDVLELMDNDYEDLGGNPTEAQRTAFKDLEKKDWSRLIVFPCLILRYSLETWFQCFQHGFKLHFAPAIAIQANDIPTAISTTFCHNI